jgi:ribosomal protein S18 acetylase RimI-like enzyme
MESSFLPVITGEHVTQISERQWHALDDDCVVGRGELSRRPDGRQFVSIDAWHSAVFDRLAEAMLTNLPKPLYTVVDEADLVLLSQWEKFGFGPRRREWEFVVPTDPQVTGLGSAPPGVTILATGEAAKEPLRVLDRVIREEVDTTLGWQNMPAEVLLPADRLDPARYVVAEQSGEYVGLARVAPLPRRPRIGLIAVRADARRRGIARALLAEVLGSAHRLGVATASADVNEANAAAIALFEGVGARRASSNLELVLR